MDFKNPNRKVSKLTPSGLVFLLNNLLVKVYFTVGQLFNLTDSKIDRAMEKR